MAKKVLLLTYSGDSLELMQQLTSALKVRDAEALRFDTDCFPMQTQAAFRQDGDTESFWFSDGKQSVQLGPEDALWYRRARYAAKLPFSLDKQIRAACIEESETLLRGMLSAVPSRIFFLPLVRVL